jgi:hypothetical protein
VRQHEARRQATADKPDVQILWTNGENPVEGATTKFIFHQIALEFFQPNRSASPSYFVSLDSERWVRRIRDALLLIFQKV